jgi:hypothetical protein
MNICVSDALHHPKRQAKLLGQLLVGLQALMIIVFSSRGGSMVVEDGSVGASTGFTGYTFYSGVIVMMVVGFGYLMTFLKWYGFGSIGFCLLVTALCLQWALCIETFWEQMYNNTWGPVCAANLCAIVGFLYNDFILFLVIDSYGYLFYFHYNLHYCCTPNLLRCSHRKGSSYVLA